jgi:hypothetical protein
VIVIAIGDGAPGNAGADTDPGVGPTVDTG